MGDLNEIIGLSEKEGGCIRPRKQMANFVSTIDHCGLCDLVSLALSSLGFIKQLVGFK